MNSGYLVSQHALIEDKRAKKLLIFTVFDGGDATLLVGSRITSFYTNDIFTGQVRETPRLAFGVTHISDT